MRFALAILVAMVAPAAARPKDPPCAVAVVVDRALPDLDAVKRGVTEMAGVLDASDRFAVVAFDGSAKVVVPLQAPGARAIAAGVARIEPASDGWNVLAGIEAAHRVLARRTERCKRVLVMTNGIAQLGLQELGRKLRDDDIEVSAIGMRAGNRSTLQAIAVGGRIYMINDPTQLARIAQRETTPVATDRLAVVVLLDRTLGEHHERGKEVVRSALDVFGPADQVAILAFDRQVTTLVPLANAANKLRMYQEIGRLQATLNPDLAPALTQARDLLANAAADQLHVVVVSDGELVMDGVLDVVRELASRNVMVSAVGVGNVKRDTLDAIAAAGEGRMFLSDDVQVMARLFPRTITGD